jgi:hypothetical protein
MEHLFAQELVRIHLAERLASTDLSTAPVRMRPGGRRHRFGRRKRHGAASSIT